MSLTAYLWSLFTSAFISSTILPGGSEALLVWGMNQFASEIWLIVSAATAGNTLGACVTYWMGRLIPNKKQDARSLKLFKKWGIWTLFFSWVPVVGDGFCLAAGWLRMNFAASFFLIFAGKLARYAALALAAQKVLS